MGPVGLRSHGTRALASLAIGLSRVGRLRSPSDGTSPAAAADEKAYRPARRRAAALAILHENECSWNQFPPRPYGDSRTMSPNRTGGG
jgi:hypothetical protein